MLLEMDTQWELNLAQTPGVGRKWRWAHKFNSDSRYMLVFSCNSLEMCMTQMSVLVAQFCPTLCDPVDCSPPGSSVHGILQTRILEWAAILFSRGSSRPKDQTWVSCIAGRFLTIWVTREGTKLSPKNAIVMYKVWLKLGYKILCAMIVFGYVLLFSNFHIFKNQRALKSIGAHTGCLLDVIRKIEK